MPPNQVYNTLSDLASAKPVIPANYLLSVTDANGNEVSHRNVSRPYDQTDTVGYFAGIFGNGFPYAFPLTFSFSADPNAQSAASTPDF